MLVWQQLKADVKFSSPRFRSRGSLTCEQNQNECAHLVNSDMLDLRACVEMEKQEML